MEYECFNGQVAVITGAGGEIGGGTAEALAKYGIKLALIDIHQGRLNETVDNLTKMGVAPDRIFHKFGDVTKSDDVTSFVDDVMRTFGKINILLNVVGAKRIKVLKNASMEDFDWCINGNLKSIFMMTQACQPHLVATKGNVINVSSVSGMRPVWGALPYAMAKAAVDQFTRCVSQEMAPQGVRVNAVSPGALKSRFNIRFGDIFTQESQLERYFDVAGRSIPLGYMGTWKDVVPTIVFLASDMAPFITGAVIAVDGGYVNTCSCP